MRLDSRPCGDEDPDPNDRSPGEGLSWQAVVLAAVAAWTVVDPYLSLRYGGIVAGFLAITRIRHFLPGRTDALAAGFFVWSILSNSWAAFPSQSWEATKNQAAVLGLFVGCRAVLTTRRNLQTVAFGFLAGAALAIYLLWSIRDVVVPELDAALGEVRVGVFSANKNYIAYALATACAVLTLLCIGVRRARWVLICVGIPLIGVCVYLIGSRGATLSVALALVWLLVHRAAPRLALRSLAVLSVIVVVVIASGIADQLLTPEQQSGRETGTLNGRLLVWPIARETFSQHPVLGIGIGAFRESNPFDIVAHNALLEVGVGLGIVGIVLFFSILHSALMHDTRAISNSTDRALIVGTLIAVTLPIFSSGNWDQSAAGWMATALVSRASILYSCKSLDDGHASSLRPSSMVGGGRRHRLPSRERDRRPVIHGVR